MLYAVLNKSWKQFLTKQQLHGHLPLISLSIQVGWARYAEHCWWSKEKLLGNVLLHMDTLVLADQQKLMFISFMRTLDAINRTYQE